MQADLPSASASSTLQRRLLRLAGGFLLLYALALTLAPLVHGEPLQTSALVAWVILLLWGLVFNLAEKQIQRKLPLSDPYLLPIVALLSGWGSMTIGRLLPAFGVRQALWMTAGGSLLILSMRLPSHLDFLRRYKYLWLSSGLVLTALTLALGTNPLGYGPRLWLGCCGLYLQPSEPLKLLLVVFLAAYFAERIPLLRINPHTPGKAPLAPLALPTLMLVGVALGLLITQRDLGTASIFLFLYTTMLYLATGQKRVLWIAALLLPLAALVGYAWFAVVRVRVDAWLNPWLDPSGNSYQIVQSLLAIANGGLLGRGPGLGYPALVPVAHSDFIFAALAEETGLAGVIGLLVLLALLVQRGMRAAILSKNLYHRYLGAGISLYLGAQSVLIIGGNLRLLPLTGVTLPFVSYGGSSLLTSFLALALLLHISAQSEEDPPLQAEETHTPSACMALSALLLAGFAAVALLSGWWALYRAPALLTRPDNARRSIASRYVPRGDIRARDGSPLALTVGEPGAYNRLYLQPALSPVIGYTQAAFGESGLEASMDATLRGLEGYPAETLWQYHLLYGTPPPGLSIRTSLAPSLQTLADSLLEGQHGALVLLNATNGEIYVMASHPGFDANHLQETWQDLLQASDAPLLNRATLGQYPAGPAATPFLLAAHFTTRNDLPPLPARSNYVVQGVNLTCALPPAEDTWSAWLQAGCPATLVALHIPWDAGLPAGVGEHIPLRLPTLPEGTSPPTGSLEDTLGVSSSWQVSPLDMALAAAALSNDGVRPAPRLVTARQTPEDTWQTLPVLGASQTVFSAPAARQAAQMLASSGKPWWLTVALAPAGEQAYTWVLGGTLPDQPGTPLAIALVLESPQPQAALGIAAQVLTSAWGGQP